MDKLNRLYERVLLKESNESIIRDFLDGKDKGKSGQLKLVNYVLYNYGTPIARISGTTLYINKQKYSATTTTITNKIRSLAAEFRYTTINEVTEDKVEK
jgi:hypothetical protein